MNEDYYTNNDQFNLNYHDIQQNQNQLDLDAQADLASFIPATNTRSQTPPNPTTTQQQHSTQQSNISNNNSTQQQQPPPPSHSRMPYSTSPPSVQYYDDDNIDMLLNHFPTEYNEYDHFADQDHLYAQITHTLPPQPAPNQILPTLDIVMQQHANLHQQQPKDIITPHNQNAYQLDIDSSQPYHTNSNYQLSVQQQRIRRLYPFERRRLEE